MDPIRFWFLIDVNEPGDVMPDEHGTYQIANGLFIGKVFRNPGELDTALEEQPGKDPPACELLLLDYDLSAAALASVRDDWDDDALVRELLGEVFVDEGPPTPQSGAYNTRSVLGANSINYKGLFGAIGCAHIARMHPLAAVLTTRFSEPLRQRHPEITIFEKWLESTMIVVRDEEVGIRTWESLLKPGVKGLRAAITQAVRSRAASVDERDLEALLGHHPIDVVRIRSKLANVALPLTAVFFDHSGNEIERAAAVWAREVTLATFGSGNRYREYRDATTLYEEYRELYEGNWVVPRYRLGRLCRQLGNARLAGGALGQSEAEALAELTKLFEVDIGVLMDHLDLENKFREAESGILVADDPLFMGLCKRFDLDPHHLLANITPAKRAISKTNPTVVSWLRTRALWDETPEVARLTVWMLSLYLGCLWARANALLECLQKVFCARHDNFPPLDKRDMFLILDPLPESSVFTSLDTPRIENTLSSNLKNDIGFCSPDRRESTNLSTFARTLNWVGDSPSDEELRRIASGWYANETKLRNRRSTSSGNLASEVDYEQKESVLAAVPPPTEVRSETLLAELVLLAQDQENVLLISDIIDCLDATPAGVPDPVVAEVLTGLVAADIHFGPLPAIRESQVRELPGLGQIGVIGSNDFRTLAEQAVQTEPSLVHLTRMLAFGHTGVLASVLESSIAAGAARWGVSLAELQDNAEKALARALRAYRVIERGSWEKYAEKSVRNEILRVLRRARAAADECWIHLVPIDEARAKPIEGDWDDRVADEDDDPLQTALDILSPLPLDVRNAVLAMFKPAHVYLEREGYLLPSSITDPLHRRLLFLAGLKLDVT
jgi:hypothetical protein